MCEVKIFHLHSGIVFQKKMQYNEITINLECSVFTGVSNFDLEELALRSVSTERLQFASSRAELTLS